ncbi:fibronectin type III domain-containing protein, partial [Agrobacterium sp. S2]|nr:fibronectin type III domain-containing protein [Agrobacterium sp. S2]
QITLSWTPGYDNGAPITDYELRSRVADGGWSSWKSTQGKTSWSVTDAENGQVYAFEVRGVNKAGPGDAGTATAKTFGLPGVPDGLSAVGSMRAGPDQGTVDLSWSSAPGNGSAVTAYAIRVNGSGDGREVPAVQDHERQSYTWTGLRGGEPVSFQVRARNEGGWSQWSNPASATPLTAPSVPTDLSVTI